ncbi:MAG: hypothetical protein AAFV71_14615 [Cyanobacteria bacterium J06633_8]
MALGANKGNSSSRSSSSNGQNRTSKTSNQAIPKTWFKILYFLLVAAGLYFAFMNINPYVVAIKMIAPQLETADFMRLMSFIPIINGVANAIGQSIYWIIGAIFWGCIQLIEVTPIVLYQHGGFLKEVIGNAEASSQYQIKDGDDPTLKALKAAYNLLPIGFIKNLDRLRVFTYTVDALVCLSVYSPVDTGKLHDFFWVITTGQWQRINYQNLVLSFFTLFAIEAILYLILNVGKLAFAVRKASR